MSDPTDPGAVGGAHSERATRTPRSSAGSPVGSPLTIGLAVVAVVLGFLIFRSLDNGSGSANANNPVAPANTVAGAPAPTTTVAGDAAATTTTAATTSTGREVTGASVMVANASATSGAAADMTEQLAAVDYTMTEPGTDTNNDALDASIVYYAAGEPAVQQVAESVARDLGGVSVQPLPATIPVQGGSIGAASVLVLLGSDMAGKPLAPVVGASTAAAPTVAATTTTTT